MIYIFVKQILFIKTQSLKLLMSGNNSCTMNKSMNTGLIYIVNKLVNMLPSSRLFAVKRRLWQACGLRVSEGVSINTGAQLFGSGSVAIGADTWVGIGCTFIVPNGANVLIGSRCDIAPDVMFECGTHRIGGASRRAGEGIAASISVGEGSWIGARAVLLGGAEVGPGSIVAAGALVRAGVYPDQALLAGVPARVVRQLSEEVANLSE